MKNIYYKLYTKEHGRFDLTLEEFYNFDLITRICHRTDGPACIYYYKDGSVSREFYYINNKVHRTDGPALIWYNQDGSVSSKHYYINDKRHRLDGPACIYYHEYGSVRCEEYYINHKPYNKEDYYNLINEMKALPKTLKLVHEDWWVREL